MKKYIVKYRRSPNEEWETLRQCGSYIISVGGNIDIAQWAKLELANQLHEKIRHDTIANAYAIRNYALANQYPDWQGVYEQVSDYEWTFEEYKP